MLKQSNRTTSIHYLLCFLFVSTIYIISIRSFADDVNIERYALVIGNSNYPLSPLDNAKNDAFEVSRSLTKLDFTVMSLYDVSAEKLKTQVTKFYRKIKQQQDNNTQSLALVYYAGHAIQIKDRNYLVPVDINFENTDEFLANLFDITELFSFISEYNNLQSVIILDACRNNPFEGVSLAISNGLAPIKAPTDTLIAYATEPGGVASDGMNDNGMYTKHLLQFIQEKITVEELFKKVRQGVATETRRRQIPWEHSSLLNDVYINPPTNKGIPDLVVF